MQAITSHHHEAAAPGSLNAFDCLFACGLCLLCVAPTTHPIGYPIAVLAVLMGMVWAGPATAGVFLLLFGIKMWGSVTLVHGYPGWGGKLALIAGLGLLALSMSVAWVWRRGKGAIGLLSWTVAVLFLAYLYGPKSEYASVKMINIIVNGGVFFVAFFYLLNDPRVSWAKLGVLGILASFVYLQTWSMVNPNYRPASLLDFGIVREAVGRDINKGISEVLNYQRLSLYAALGFVLVASAVLDQRVRATRLMMLTVTLIASSFVIMWSGARQGIVIFGIAGLSFLFVRPRAKVVTLAFVLSAVAASVIIVILGWTLRMPFITEVIESSGTWTERINRAGNFDIAAYIIKDNPIFGAGLGGFAEFGDVSRRQSVNAEIGRSYAHNIFLELLTETGIVGTVAILCPWAIAVSRSFRAFGLRLRSMQGAIVIPLVVCIFLRAMISSDLIENIALFALVAAALATYQAEEYVTVKGKGATGAVPSPH